MKLRSQVRFFMHPEDERAFVNSLLQDESVFLIAGPRWETSSPPTTRVLAEILDDYCIIWSKLDMKRLRAQFIKECGDWYCSSEQATIQFLRSKTVGNNVITEGRIAVSTPDYVTKSFSKQGIVRLEKRFRLAKRYIQSKFRNCAVAWFSPDYPRKKVGERWMNPSEPETQVWLGPSAEAWLKESSSHELRQHDRGVRAILVEDADYG